MSIPLLFSKRAFHPRQLFSALQGAWLEPTQGYIWQENTGVTPTTTGGQTLGRIADLSGYGNVATQATAANRPTYQLDSNGLPLARHDATDSLVVSLPSLGGGIYSASGSVYFSTPVGMSALHNQSMGTSYTLPALSTDIYSWIVVPQRLNTALEGRLERYMLRKANLAEPDYLLDNSDNQLTADDGTDLLLRA